MLSKGVLRLDGQEMELIRRALLQSAQNSSGMTALQLEILAGKVSVAKARFHQRVYAQFQKKYNLSQPFNPNVRRRNTK